MGILYNNLTEFSLLIILLTTSLSLSKHSPPASRDVGSACDSHGNQFHCSNESCVVTEQHGSRRIKGLAKAAKELNGALLGR